MVTNQRTKKAFSLIIMTLMDSRKAGIPDKTTVSNVNHLLEQSGVSFEKSLDLSDLCAQLLNSNKGELTAKDILEFFANESKKRIKAKETEISKTNQQGV